VADLAEAQGDQPLTTLIRLKNADADTMLAALRHSSANPRSPSSTLPPTLILAGSAAQIGRIART
jgi:hypothetical protein